jgi:hypothetical protein
MTSRKPFYRSLYFQVIVAILLGVLLGHFWPQTGASLKPLGDGFIKLVKMMIAPIIFCTVVTGIAGMEDMKKVGRVGGKALLYFDQLDEAIAQRLERSAGLRPEMTKQHAQQNGDNHLEVKRTVKRFAGRHRRGLRRGKKPAAAPIRGSAAAATVLRVTGGDIARICCNVKLGLPLFGKTLMNRDSGDGTTLDEPPQLRHAWPHIQTNV